jgi:hypothetical protein
MVSHYDDARIIYNITMNMRKSLADKNPPQTPPKENSGGPTCALLSSNVASVGGGGA